MKLVITKNYAQSAKLCSEMIMDVVREKRDSLLGLATGSTPIQVYDYMVKAVKEGNVDFSGISTINLDEYIGLSNSNHNSYFYFMKKFFFDKCGIKQGKVMIPNGTADVNMELERMNNYANSHQIDVQLLSVGVNGHIGFNEPSDRFYDQYHIVNLTEQTRKSNSRLFTSIEEVPRSAITMGVGGIMRAKKIAFLATGEEKLNAMKAILEKGDVTPEKQGTILKFHPDCTVFLDYAVAEKITPADYVEIHRV